MAVQSQNFADSAWIEHIGTTKVGVAPVADPAGGSNAFEVAFGTSGGSSALYQVGVPALPGGSVMLSCWVRAKTGTSSIRFTIYDLLVDAASSDIAINTTWQRISFTVSTQNIGSWNFALRTNTAGTTGSVYIFGFQVEAGQLATSYIPTTSAAVTRAADGAVMMGANFSSWYLNTGEGTILLDFDSNGFHVSQHWINLNRDGLAADRIVLFGPIVDWGSVYISSGGVATVEFNPLPNSGSNMGYRQKLGLAFKTDDVAARTENPATLLTDSTATIPVNLNRLQLGADETGGANVPPIMHVRALRFYNFRKSNAELADMVAL